MRGESVHFSDWSAIEQAVTQAVCTSSDPFAQETIANVQNLIDACREACPIPEGVAKGYWCTIRFCWRDREVEIFDDHYELYRFQQGHTDIKHFNHMPGTIIPAELMKYLSMQEQAQA